MVRAKLVLRASPSFLDPAGTPAPDLVVRSDTQTLLAVAAGRIEPVEAVASGAIEIEGDLDARERCMKMLGAC
jgi:putative sterol carrier protein